MNTTEIEQYFAEKYKYKKLPEEASEAVRDYYERNVPEHIKLEGEKAPLFTSEGTKLCDEYDRVVIGDYGAFVEFSEPASEFIIKPGQEYRVNDERYKTRIKYIWLTTKDKSDIKIYLQKRTVTYADYKPGKYYVSVHEAYKEN